MSAYPHLDELTKEVSETAQFGSLQDRIADAAFRLGKSLGIDENSPEMASYIRDKLAEGVNREIIDKPPVRVNGQVISDVLSDDEREAARISGIDEATYLEQKKLAIEAGVYDRHRNGF